MKQYLILIILSLFISCTQQKNWEQEKAFNSQSKAGFDFSAFPVDKAKVGSIRIGMTITQAEQHLKGLTKEVSEAINFGYGGGSPAYVYSFSKQPLLVLIPKLDTDTTLLIIAIHKNLRTTNGLTPNSTVAELLEKYPNLTINQDLMNSWEYATDTTNQWDFVFATDENQQVGEYPELEVPSKPKRLAVKTNWITIR